MASPPPMPFRQHQQTLGLHAEAADRTPHVRLEAHPTEHARDLFALPGLGDLLAFMLVGEPDATARAAAFKTRPSSLRRALGGCARAPNDATTLSTVILPASKVAAGFPRATWLQFAPTSLATRWWWLVVVAKHRCACCCDASAGDVEAAV